MENSLFVCATSMVANINIKSLAGHVQSNIMKLVSLKIK